MGWCAVSLGCHIGKSLTNAMPRIFGTISTQSDPIGVRFDCALAKVDGREPAVNAYITIEATLDYPSEPQGLLCSFPKIGWLT